MCQFSRDSRICNPWRIGGLTVINEYILKELELPCGVTIKNRITKSPMSDSLGDGEGNPTDAQIRLYEKWAQGGAGLSIIGEVQGTPKFPEKPSNLVLGNMSKKAKYKNLTSRAVINGAHLWAQLGHAGALSHAPISIPKGPSELNIESLKCAEMSLLEIQALPQFFAQTALKAKELGFSGVLIHAGHGFLLSQFLSQLFNLRKDQYGGGIENRSRIILEIIQEVRHELGDSFPIGIRINSSDLLEGGLTEADALVLVKLLDNTSIDLIDISGGTYFPGAKASSEGSNGGPYFINFARSARNTTNKPLMLSGGFKNYEQINEVLADGIVDMVGLGRGLILNPELPNLWIRGERINPIFPRFNETVPGGMTAWYTMKMVFLGEDKDNAFNMSLASAIKGYEDRVEQQTQKWKKTFF